MVKNVLLLGGFGFIGTNILKYVDNHDDLFNKYQFIVFDRFQYHPHNVQFQCVRKVYAGDFSDETFLKELFRQNRIDIVVHSLSSTVPATSQNAYFDVETNLLPTLKLLRIMEEHGVHDIVYLLTFSSQLSVPHRQLLERFFDADVFLLQGFDNQSIVN